MRVFLGANLPCKRSVQNLWFVSATVSATILIVANLTGLCLPVLAETKQVRAVIHPDRDQSFLEMMQQAESQAAQLVEQVFTESRSVTIVSVVILGERNGQQIPLLTSTVSRTSWRKTPRIQAWAKYFGNASVTLLGFAKLPTPQADPALAPVSTPVTSDIPPPQSPASSAFQPAPGIFPDPAAPSANPSAKPNQTPASSGFTPTRTRIQDDPGYRDD